MKNESLKLRSSFFFRHRKRFYSRDSSKHMPELVKPESERTESVIEDILRWADDGGRTLSQSDRVSTPPSGGDKHSPADGCR